MKSFYLKSRVCFFITLTGFLLYILLFFLFSENIASFLSIIRPIKANVLIVEGWIPHNDIEKSIDIISDPQYDYILTTGGKVDPFYPVVMNGSLVFYTHAILREKQYAADNKISVYAYGELGGSHCSQFKVIVNDSVIGQFCAGKKKKKYVSQYFGVLSNIDSIAIQFTNDSMGTFGDHNLYIKELIINSQIYIPYTNNSIYERTAKGWEKRIILDYNTYAEFTKNYLLELGIDSRKIIAISETKNHGNRTLESAQGINTWIKLNNNHVDGINVLSAGQHSRRSWLTYEKLVPINQKVGILTCDTSGKEESRTISFIQTLKEFHKLLYYKIILLFF